MSWRRQRATPEQLDAHLARIRRKLATANAQPKGSSKRTDRDVSGACTCQSQGECSVCQAWAKRMLEMRGGPAPDPKEADRTPPQNPTEET